MITAVAKSTKEVVVAASANGREEYSCPDCKQPVYPRHRANWVDHFVHKKYSECRTKLVASLESEEHKLGKQLIVDWLKKNKSPSDEVVTEKVITTANGTRRKIDIALVRDGNVVWAHECQLSPICIYQEKDGLLARTLDYHRLGISVFWWLGNKVETDTVRDFLWNILDEEDLLWNILDEEDQRLWGGELHKKIVGGIRICPPDKSFWITCHVVKCPSAKLQEIIQSQDKAAMNTEKEDSLKSSIPPEVFKEETFLDTSIQNQTSKDPKSSTLISLFKYANPQTARLLIKEAIANALDQSPADATSLCAAWEEIQPTLGEATKPTPLLTDGVAAESVPFATNGNGRH